MHFLQNDRFGICKLCILNYLLWLGGSEVFKRNVNASFLN